MFILKLIWTALKHINYIDGNQQDLEYISMKITELLISH